MNGARNYRERTMAIQGDLVSEPHHYERTLAITEQVHGYHHLETAAAAFQSENILTPTTPKSP